MHYEFHYTVKPSDIRQVRMYYAYSSVLAVVNLVCIASSIALIVATWHTAAPWFKVAMAIFFSLFTVIQPLVIYITSRAQLRDGAPELTLAFSDEGILIREGGKSEKRAWDEVVSFTVRPTLVAVYTDEKHGYILTNRILGKERAAFIQDAGERWKKAREKRGQNR